MKSTIPIKKKLTIMKEISSPLIKQVQYYNNNLQARISIEGWDRNITIIQKNINKRNKKSSKQKLGESS